MAIIIDTNCFSKVFNSADKDHEDFAPVLNWIASGNGFIVYGGTKYMEELQQSKKYLRFFNILKGMGKAIEFKKECKRIDQLTDDFDEKYGNSDFDDPHLPAIAIVTKCRIICSVDARSIPYVTDPSLYPKKFNVPIYYTCKKNKKILVDSNIDPRLNEYKIRLGKSNKQRLLGMVE